MQTQIKASGNEELRVSDHLDAKNAGESTQRDLQGRYNSRSVGAKEPSGRRPHAAWRRHAETHEGAT